MRSTKVNGNLFQVLEQSHDVKYHCKHHFSFSDIYQAILAPRVRNTKLLSVEDANKMDKFCCIITRYTKPCINVSDTASFQYIIEG